MPEFKETRDLEGADITRAAAHLPGLDIEVTHRRSADAEQIAISLTAVPSFDAFGRMLEGANPFMLWAQFAQLAWQPWLATARYDRAVGVLAARAGQRRGTVRAPGAGRTAIGTRQPNVRSKERIMHPNAFIWVINALWLLLVVYLTVAAAGAKPDTQPHLLQSLALLCAIVVAFLLPHLAIFRFVNFAPVNTVLSSIGLALTVAGMAFLVWGRQHLGGNWSQTVAAKEGHELVTSGPYRYVRHPMYTGGFVACIGSAIVAGGPFVFLLIVLGGIFLWRVRAEDRLMARQFRDEFPTYAARTKALIPFVW